MQRVVWPWSAGQRNVGPHTVGNLMAAFYSATGKDGTPQPRAYSQTESAVPRSRGPALLLQLLMLREVGRAEGQKHNVLTPHMSGYIVWHQTPSRCFLPAAEVPPSALRPAEGLESQQKTMPKTLSFTQNIGRGSRWAWPCHGWSRREVTRWAERCGELFYTVCKFLLHCWEHRGVKRRPSRKTLLRTPNRIF